MIIEKFEEVIHEDYGAGEAEECSDCECPLPIARPEGRGMVTSCPDCGSTFTT